MLHLSRNVRPMMVRHFACKVTLKGALTFKHLVHVWTGPCQNKVIPFWNSNTFPLKKPHIVFFSSQSYCTSIETDSVCEEVEANEIQECVSGHGWVGTEIQGPLHTLLITHLTLYLYFRLHILQPTSELLSYASFTQQLLKAAINSAKIMFF